MNEKKKKNNRKFMNSFAIETTAAQKLLKVEIDK